jgi:2-(1,2-epoxy-1,2-dihydrophenyl)acetyl-CoA isomerase
MDEAGPPLLVAVDEGIARLRLNRPRRFNALDGPTIEALVGTLVRLRSDEGVKALLLSGDRRSFCFGADLTALPRESTGSRPSVSCFPLQAMIAALALRSRRSRSCRGSRRGPGSSRARVRSPDRVGQGEAGRRIRGDGARPRRRRTHRLPRLVGLGRAFELLFSEEAVPAERAEAIGLVNRVVPQDELDAPSRGRVRSRLFRPGPCAPPSA